MYLERWSKDRQQPQLKARRLLERFRGSQVRLYEYLSGRKLSSEERASLGEMLSDGYQIILTRDDYMKMYPRVVAHIICESLGYATPTVAAVILKDRMESGKNWCEWIYSCYACDATKPVRHAIERRHTHNGYMAKYKQAIALVRHSVNGGREPELASWF